MSLATKTHELHDEEQERALLCCIALKPDLLHEIYEYFRLIDFHNPYNREICLAIEMLDSGGEKTDPTTLKTTMVRMGYEFDAGYVARVLSEQATPYNALTYAKALGELSQRRLIMEMSRNLQKIAKDRTQEISEAIRYSRECIEVLDRKTKGGLVERLQDHADVAIESIPKPKGTYSATGFAQLDELFGFLQPCELTCIGARPGGGKTTFSMQIAMQNADMGRNVLYCSLEMGGVEFVKRAFCLKLGIDPRTLRSGEGYDAELEKIKELTRQWHESDYGFHLWDPPRATEADICGRARYLHATVGLDMVIVDHLQITGCSDRRLEKYQKLGHITKELKALSKELNIPVIAQSQLKRSEERPTLSSLRESGDIEQNADNVWLLHHWHEVRGDMSGERDRLVEIIVEKNRHGDTGCMPLEFIGGKFYGEKPYTEFEG